MTDLVITSNVSDEDGLENALYQAKTRVHEIWDELDAKKSDACIDIEIIITRDDE